MIFTGYFGKVKEYTDRHLKLVSIANSTIRTTERYKIFKFPSLAPGSWIYNWKSSLKNGRSLDKAKNDYINNYYTKCLNGITPKNLFDSLYNFTDGYDAILLCYEKPPIQMQLEGIIKLDWLEAGTSFCHRHLVADFLRDGGYECREYVL